MKRSHELKTTTAKRRRSKGLSSPASLRGAASRLAERDNGDASVDGLRVISRPTELRDRPRARTCGGVVLSRPHSWVGRLTVGTRDSHAPWYGAGALSVPPRRFARSPRTPRAQPGCVAFLSLELDLARASGSRSRRNVQLTCQCASRHRSAENLASLGTQETSGSSGTTSPHSAAARSR